MSLIYFIILSILPSIVWLLFFLREDRRPEPKGVILKVFAIGMLLPFPVIVLGLIVGFILKEMGVPLPLIFFIGVVFIAGIVEELGKYLVVRQSVMKSSAVDEPSDFMIYAITAALGFAAMENLFFLFPGYESLFIETPSFLLQELIAGSLIRFVSGTFLHALASGIMGYFLALSIMMTRRRKIIIRIGLLIAILLHGFYNFSIITAEKNATWFVVAPVLLLLMFISVLFLFAKTRKMESICRLENENIQKQ